MKIKSILLSFVLTFIVSGCVIDNDNIRISKYQIIAGPQYFNSCVIEKIGDNEERHILSFCVDPNKATYTYLYQFKYLISRDTVIVYVNDSTLRTYTVGNYGYDSRDPYTETVEINKYKEELDRIHTRYLDSPDSIIMYRNIPCKRKVFESMYDEYIDN